MNRQQERKDKERRKWRSDYYRREKKQRKGERREIMEGGIKKRMDNLEKGKTEKKRKGRK